MGSSPVTATISPLDAACAAVPAAPGDLLLVAFSGGPDSTALLLGLRRAAPVPGVELVAAHVDHRLDPGSGARAGEARRLAARLGVPFRLLVAPEPGYDTEGTLEAPAASARDGREAVARRLRYRLLGALAVELGARFLVTAHHADDQAETVLLRLAHGSGLAGLAGIPERTGPLLRPLLALTRAQLAAAVAAAGLVPVEDPTNRDLAVPRNRLRHRLLPALGGAAAAARARAVGAAAATLAAGVERRLASELPELAAPGPARLSLPALHRLPPELLPWALALLHRRAGADYPPRAAAVAELARQLARGGAVGCDCGAGWRWRIDEEGCLRPGGPAAAGDTGAQPAPPPGAKGAPFAYTVAVPGGVEIREADATFRLSRQPVAAWMRCGSPGRAALDLPLAPGADVTVRSRRPGDRLHPFGCGHGRRLKDVLIDAKVPRTQRDRLPLLCVDGQVAWVPGVTIHHPFRLREGAAEAWVAEILPRRE